MQLVAAAATAVHLEREGQSPGHPLRARPVPALQGEDPLALRADAVRALLHRRGQAVLHRDREAFLADVDPAASRLRARQSALFDALRDVPIGRWDYVLDSSRQRGHDAALDRRHGPGWWAPDVVLRYALEGYDPVPAWSRQHLTFVTRAGRWYLAADDDFAVAGDDSGRGLWDGGPVVVGRGRSSLVLAHPGSKQLLPELVEQADDAVARVTRRWPSWSRKVVVLVPDTQRELGRLTGTREDLSQIAAVAVAELLPGGAAAGDRIVLNPATFPRLASAGRRVVLTHEVTHVATRDATGPAVPVWLAEGFADWVAFDGLQLPLSVAAREAVREARAGRLPAQLPSDAVFRPGNPRLALVYEQAWLAVARLAEVFGPARLVAFYRAVGAARGRSALAVDDAFRSELGTTRPAFVRDWRATLRLRLA